MSKWSPALFVRPKNSLLGGTLIANNGSTRRLISNHSFGNVKNISDSFARSHDYNISLIREFQSRNINIDVNSINNNKLNLNIINKPFKYNGEWIICRLDDYKESKLDKNTVMNLKSKILDEEIEREIINCYNNDLNKLLN